MPSEQENVQYLYLILTHGGVPTIDWDAIGTAMDLKKGAVSKRWSRLKKSMEAGETPSGSVYKFLWLCVKHSTRDKVPDWNEIAKLCGTTSGAASKRYSRMKQAFEAGGAPPEVNPASPAPKTPSKKTKAIITDGEGTPTPTPTPTPKRKRANPKKAVSEDDTEMSKPEQETEEDEETISPKKAKATQPKASVKSNVNTETEIKIVKEVDELIPTVETTTLVKNEFDDGSEEPFVDAKQWVNDHVGDESIVEGEDGATRASGCLSETA